MLPFERLEQTNIWYLTDFFWLIAAASSHSVQKETVSRSPCTSSTFYFNNLSKKKKNPTAVLSREAVQAMTALL